MNDSAQQVINFLQKWTPLSVSIIIILVFSLAVAGYSLFVGKDIPQWDANILIAVTSVLASAGLINHGVTTAIQSQEVVKKEGTNASS